MANSVEFLLKLNADNFKAGIEQAKNGFKGLDQASTGVNIAQARLAAMDKATDELNKRLADSKVHLASIGAGFLAAGGVAALAAKSYSDFAQKMAEINTLVDVTPEKFKELENGIRQAALTMGTSASDTAGAVYEIISSGVQLKDSVEVVNLSTKAAVAGVSDVQSTAKLGLSVLNAYGRGVGDLESVYDTLFQTVKDGVTTLPELSHHLGMVLPTASAAGVGINDVAASIATMTKVGIRTPQAVTALNGAIRSMAAPTGEAKEKMEALGITWEGLIPTLTKLKAQNLSIGQLRELIPDSEAATGTLALLNNFEGLKTSLEGMENAAGATQKAYGIMAQTPEQAMKNFMAAIRELGLQLGSLVVQFQPVVEITTDWIRGFAAMPDSVKILALALAGAAAGGIALRTVIIDVAKVTTALRTVETLVTAGQAAAAIGGAAPAVAATATATTGLVGSMTAARAAAAGLIASMGPLLPLLAAAGAAFVATEIALAHYNAETEKIEKQADSVIKVAKTYGDLEKRLKDAGGGASVLNAELRAAKVSLMESAGAGADIEAAAVKKIIAEHEAKVARIETLNKELLESQKVLGDLEVAKKQADLANMTEAERVHATNVKELSGDALQKKINDLQAYVDKTKSSLEAAKNEQQKFTDQIKNLETQKANSAQSTEDKIRELRRQGMSEAEAQADVQSQINEKIRASNDALNEAKKTGDQTAFDRAKALADSAKALASGAGNVDQQIAALQKTEAATQAVIDAEIQAAQVKEIAAAKKVESLDAELEKVNALLTAAKEQVLINIDADIEQADANITKIKNELAELKDKTVTVTVKNVEGHSAGGPIGLARGGRLPGYGGGDRISALLEAGEFVHNKHAVSYYGDSLMAALNARAINRDALMAAVTMAGSPSAINNIAAPGIQKFADGGAVQAGSTNDIITLQIGANRLDTSSGRKQALSFIDTLIREAGRV